MKKRELTERLEQFLIMIKQKLALIEQIPVAEETTTNIQEIETLQKEYMAIRQQIASITNKRNMISAVLENALQNPLSSELKKQLTQTHAQIKYGLDHAEETTKTLVEAIQNLQDEINALKKGDQQQFTKYYIQEQQLLEKSKGGYRKAVIGLLGALIAVLSTGCATAEQIQEQPFEEQITRPTIEIPPEITIEPIGPIPEYTWEEMKFDKHMFEDSAVRIELEYSKNRLDILARSQPDDYKNKTGMFAPIPVSIDEIRPFYHIGIRDPLLITAVLIVDAPLQDKLIILKLFSKELNSTQVDEITRRGIVSLIKECHYGSLTLPILALAKHYEFTIRQINNIAGYSEVLKNPQDYNTCAQKLAQFKEYQLIAKTNDIPFSDAVQLFKNNIEIKKAFKYRDIGITNIDIMAKINSLDSLTDTEKIKLLTTKNLDALNFNDYQKFTFLELIGHMIIYADTEGLTREKVILMQQKAIEKKMPFDLVKQMISLSEYPRNENTFETELEEWFDEVEKGRQNGIRPDEILGLLPLKVDFAKYKSIKNEFSVLVSSQPQRVFYVGKISNQKGSIREICDDINAYLEAGIKDLGIIAICRELKHSPQLVKTAGILMKIKFAEGANIEAEYKFNLKNLDEAISAFEDVYTNENMRFLNLLAKRNIKFTGKLSDKMFARLAGADLYWALYSLDNYWSDLTDEEITQLANDAKYHLNMLHFYRFKPDDLRTLIKNKIAFGIGALEGEKQLLLVPREDWNAAFNWPTVYSANLKELPNLLCFEIESENEFYEKIQQVGYRDGISFLILSGHGNKTKLSFGDADPALGNLKKAEEYSLGLEDREDIMKLELHKFFTPDALIWSDSCSTAEGGKKADNLARMLFETLKTKTAASKIPYWALVARIIYKNGKPHSVMIIDEFNTVLFRKEN